MIATVKPSDKPSAATSSTKLTTTNTVNQLDAVQSDTASLAGAKSSATNFLYADSGEAQPTSLILNDGRCSLSIHIPNSADGIAQILDASRIVQLDGVAIHQTAPTSTYTGHHHIDNSISVATVVYTA